MGVSNEILCVSKENLYVSQIIFLESATKIWGLNEAETAQYPLMLCFKGRWQYPIHNGTLQIFVWSSMKLKFDIFWNNYF